MPGTGQLVLVVVSIAMMLGTGFWTNHRYSRFEHLPAHFDLRGRPTRFASRTQIAWLLPVVLSVLLLVVILALSAFPEDLRGADPFSASALCCLAMLGALALELWLLSRRTGTQR